MTEDIVARLRWWKGEIGELFEAADEIERLREALAEYKRQNLRLLGRVDAEMVTIAHNDLVRERDALRDEIERLLKLINRDPTTQECHAALMAYDKSLCFDANDQIIAVSYAVEAAFRMRATNDR